MMSGSRQSRLAAMLAAVTVLAFVLVYAAVGLVTLDPASRSVPTLAAIVTGVLIGIELLRSYRAADRERVPSTFVASEWLVIMSVIGAVAGIYLVGFLIAVPVYLTIAIALIGRRSLRTAFLTALLTTAAIYVAFELVLSYRLFPGIVFS